jgi:hypothetical protein
MDLYVRRLDSKFPANLLVVDLHIIKSSLCRRKDDDNEMSIRLR